MFNDFLIYFFMFFIYSFLGWIIESTYVASIEKKFVNRGFLIGPYLPIYGVSSVIMILYLRQYKDNAITVFILAMFICTFLEYITSYIMEKLFNARWWDYSKMKWNLNGRVCLKNSLLFGLLGIILIYLLDPILTNFTNNINKTILIIISIICMVIFITDVIFSCNIVIKLKNNFNELKFDATMEIKKLIDQKLKKRYFQNRVYRAFPMIKFKRKK